MDSNDLERNLGEQPIAHILKERKLSAGDLVLASSENITYKMVSKACKGRRLTQRVQQKICNALNIASDSTYTIRDLFSY